MDDWPIYLVRLTERHNYISIQIVLCQFTSGCASPCTIQTSIASWPSPENTTGVSTAISGGSVVKNRENANEFIDYLHTILN